MLPARSAALATLVLGLVSLDAARAQGPSGPPISSQPLPPPGGPAAPPSAAPAPVPSNDPFGEEIMIDAKTIVFMKGSGTWDSAFETLVDSFKSVYGFLERQGIKPAGPAMTIYTATDDTGFQFHAAVPIAEAPVNAPRGDIEVGKSPGGRMLKFLHRGSYDAMDTTYEAITNYLDAKQLEAQEMFIEEYVTSPITTSEENLVVNVFVPVK